ncbi:MAG: bifunctional glutamate N-acetyltransferase/amino-acid acetyltransferase ArgJ [Kiritimatiellaeota bacterium]|nr:bifunctional glutamate N-acetyltransferase/amino-acid acetyltransferase ArgJ [Kiritimatiellota bacterium]
MNWTVIDNGDVTSPRGFRAAGVAAGLKQSGRPDLSLVFSDRPAWAAGAFTSNRFAAAPVAYDRALLARKAPVRGVVVNSGNANACTGARGLADAEATAAEAARLLGVSPTEILVCSTGRIGVPLSLPVLFRGLNAATAALSPDGGAAAAEAILTTDTRPKALALEVRENGATYRIGGMAKGAGMIAPKLEPPHATMLAFLTTDADVEPGFLQACLTDGLDGSFNRITVDGDTSTNDTVLLLANGAAGGNVLNQTSPGATRFRAAVAHVMAVLAREMVRDGEGATRFIELCVSGAASRGEARRCAEAIANSALCKTAWFGGDPNWGRLLAAAGYADVQVNPERVSLDYNGVPIVREGRDAGTPETEQAAALKGPECRIELDLGTDGTGTAVVWTCDLSYEYVKINAEYHT